MGPEYTDRLPKEIEDMLTENGYKFVYSPPKNIPGYYYGMYMIYWD
jgi:hypothetical protein